MNTLLDTNVVIYLMEGNERVIRAIQPYAEGNFSISMITRLEILLGIEKHSEGLEVREDYLNDFINIAIDQAVVREAAILQKTSKKKLKFKDLIIAATAKVYNATLITSDKDFKSLKGVKIVYIPYTGA